VLLNGVPIASPWDNQFDPSFIPVENIAKIKITRGPASTLYGDGGNAGVINIVTKKGRPGVHGSLNVEGGQKDELLGRATFSEGGEELNLFGSGSYMKRNDFPLPDSFGDTELESGDTRTNSDRRQGDLFANLIYTPQEATQMALTLDLKSAEYGVPPDTVSDVFTNKKPDDPGKLNYRRMDDKMATSAQLSLSHDFEGPMFLRGWTYFSSLDETENDYKGIAFEEIKSTDDRSTRRFGANIQAGVDLDALGTMTVALKGERGDIDSTVTKKGVTLIKEHTLTYSASLEYTVNPVESLGIVLGAGWHRQERTRGQDEDDSSWLAGVHYDLPTHTRLKASVARKIRFPSLRRLYEEGKGNPNLNAENTLHYQAGIEQSLPGWGTTLDLVVFRIDAEDFLEKDETLDPERYANFEEYRFQGVEASLVNRSIEDLVLQASYTYLDAENESPDPVFETLEHRPENKVTLQATYSFLERYKAHLGYLWVDERIHHSKGKQNGELIQGTLDDYHVVDCKLSRTWLDDSLETYVGARNLFDEEYAESYSLVMPGRRIYAGIEYRF
jgi:outer membrane cobalamin receptor